MNEITISGFYDEISSALSTQIAVLHELGETYMCPRNVDGKNIADYTFEEFKEKILNKEATRLGKICDHTVKLLFSAFAQTVNIKISFHNI